MHIAKVEHSEADDIIAMCKEIVFSEYPDYNIIIVSADADLRQLIDFNEITNQYCIVYNTTGKGKASKRYLYVTKTFNDWINKSDQNFDIFFENQDLSKQYIKNLLNENSIIELAEENPNNILLHKIFCGDDGDCVPSFYSWFKDGRKVRITPAKENKIREIIGINNIRDLLSGKSQLKPVFEKVCKREINDIDFDERLDRQRVLVELNSSLFPEHIQNYKNNIKEMLNNVPSKNFRNLKSVDLLKGTIYEGYDKKKVLDAEIFKGMSKYINSNGTINTNKLFG